MWPERGGPATGEAEILPRGDRRREGTVQAGFRGGQGGELPPLSSLLPLLFTPKDVGEGRKRTVCGRAAWTAPCPDTEEGPAKCAGGGWTIPGGSPDQGGWGV